VDESQLSSCPVSSNVKHGFPGKQAHSTKQPMNEMLDDFVKILNSFCKMPNEIPEFPPCFWGGELFV
jgi:hypothetical protein